MNCHSLLLPQHGVCGALTDPNYVMSGVIEGFPEMSHPMGLKDIVKKPQLKGLWTWTRGGGWWGPYIHGNEQWVDLHARYGCLAAFHLGSIMERGIESCD